MAVSVSQIDEGPPPTDWRLYATLGPEAERYVAISLVGGVRA